MKGNKKKKKVTNARELELTIIQAELGCTYEYAALVAKWRAKLGELWELGREKEVRLNR
jgi:hypothetical protein